jgi:hypothetical protein
LRDADGIEAGANQKTARGDVSSHSSERIQVTSCCKNNCVNGSIFLDTEFHQNYTFVSCNFLGRSVDKSSIGRIGKMATKKAAKKVAKKAAKKK